MRAAAFVADPAGDADGEPELQIALELVRAAGKAVRHAAPLRRVLAQDRGEVRVRIALVQEHRLADAARQLELAVERRALRGARREVAEVVEAALADGDHLAVAHELLELCRAAGIELGGVMRMHPGGGEQRTAVGARQLQRLRRCSPGSSP